MILVFLGKLLMYPISFLFWICCKFFFRCESFSFVCYFCEIKVLFFSFSMLEIDFIILIFLIIKLLCMNNYDFFKIRKYSMFFCFILFKIFCMKFFNISKLFISYFLIYSFDLYNLYLSFDYVFGLDNLSLIFIGLTLFLIPISLLISWKSLNYNLKKFFLLFLLLEILLFSVFSAIDLLLFYISFESILIPMYFLIGSWGSRDRRIHAAYQFFLFTLGGSLFMLFIIIYCQLNFGSTNLFFLLEIIFTPYLEIFMWFGFFLGFAVKIPMLPVHIWLPEAHVESATGGSVLLAGILLKLGTYGIIRFLIPLFNFGSVYFTPFVFLISFISVFYASLTTLRQVDMKKIIAYSSIIHMNYLLFGLFAYNLEGFIGSLILMIAHGFVSGGLFVCIGILYERYHTRLKKYYGSLNNFMPFFSIFFLMFTLANISFPGSVNFIGEFLVILSIFMKNIILAIILIFSMIFSACYSLWLYNKIFSGLSSKFIFIFKFKYSGISYDFLKFERLFLINYSDLNLREIFNLLMLFLPVIFFGLNGYFFISFIEYKFLFDLTYLNNSLNYEL